MSGSVTPYEDSKLNKKQQVAKMFNSIAWRYDFLNHFLSFGIDRYWRRKTISMLKKHQPQLILDVASGTADLAIAALRLNPLKVFGIDISEDMLKIGREKIRKKNLQHKIELLESDSEKLIFEDNKFDAVTVGFGVRNFEHLEIGLSEMLRVLKPGGKVVILEFSKPKSAFIKSLYSFYSSKICPWLGNMISKDPVAYTYLNKSVEAFPEGENFATILKQTGYKEVAIKTLTFGIATIYTGIK
ncbi:MAG TPA: bifunctional demethylmenaquinone methyltransferase/2-methoxy-6-polyprenyl-1,4-benzoquinol methylase UbiE [Bacteroidia bacterium]|nr:bifunctional demethylmenaquinone methyltransferase/2-methoxy-6-polyprenyl-1,4-benzoquinol methylase UbiE [Bacteroidia bacterium]